MICKSTGRDRHDALEEHVLKQWHDSLHLMMSWFPPSQKLLHEKRTGSCIAKAYESAQIQCAWILAGQETLEETTKKRQPLVVKKRGNYAYVSSKLTTDGPHVHSSVS